MAIHDWTRVEAGIFHAFHHDWITDISRALNRGILPSDYYALPWQFAGGWGPDVLTLCRPRGPDAPTGDGGLALAVAPPRVRFRVRAETNPYTARAKSVVIRHVSNHEVVAVAEIVSPGNKNSQHGLAAFVRKARQTLAAGVHLLIVDLFPPTYRDPEGLHGEIWGEGYCLPVDRRLACVAYLAGENPEAFIEPIAVGDPLPDMLLFLSPEKYVSVPLEATYQSTWEGLPAYWRDMLSATNA